MVRRGRRQPQRIGGGVVPEAGRRRLGGGHAAAAAAGRAHLQRSAARRHFAEHVCRQHPRPCARYRLRGAVRAHRSGRHPRRCDEDRHGPHAARADAGRRRTNVPRLSAGLRRAEAGAGVRGADVRLQPDLRRDRLGDGRPAARQAWRHHPRPRRPLQVQPLRIHEQRRRQSHGAARRHLLPDGRRHRGSSDRHQGRRRRRGDLRRRRQLRAVRRQGRRLHLLRRTDLPEHRRGHRRRHAVHRRLEGADGEAQPVRAGRRRCLHQLLGLEQLLHRRQRLHRPQRSGTRHRLERAERVEPVQRRRRPDLPAGDVVVRRRQALRPRPRRRLQLHRALPRRREHRDLRQSRRLGGARRPEVSAQGVLEPAAGVDRLLQQPDDELSRQPVRDRRRHAQHPRAAQPDDQLGLARVLQPAVDRRADLLDRQHCLPSAGRVDAARPTARRAW